LFRSAHFTATTGLPDDGVRLTVPGFDDEVTRTVPFFSDRTVPRAPTPGTPSGAPHPWIIAPHAPGTVGRPSIYRATFVVYNDNVPEQQIRMVFGIGQPTGFQL